MSALGTLPKISATSPRRGPRLLWSAGELIAGALLSAALLLPFHPLSQTRPASYAFEALVSANSRGFAQIYFDIGQSFNEVDSRIVGLHPDGMPRLIRFPLPAGRYGALRFDPLNGPGTVTISAACIRDDSGRLIKSFPPDRFVASNQIRRMAARGSVLTIEVEPDRFDPNTLIALDGPFTLSGSAPVDWRGSAGWFAAAYAAILLLVAVARRRAGDFPRLRSLAQRHPGRTLALVALVALGLNSYPVIFFGRSYVSPNQGVVLLYDTLPTLPGYTSTDQEDPKGSDVGAMMWWHLPVSNVEREAIFRDHELPLWNRYDLCGQPLFGQGQSMLGDPIHWATAILGGGNSWAWDLKYLLGKWLFAFGIGLTVLALTKHLGTAALLTASSLFIGFFSFRLNHPSFVTLCYSPWILYAWIRVFAADRAKETAKWVIVLLACDWWELNSGTVKEAYMLVLGLNLAGALVLALNGGGWGTQRRKWTMLAWGNLLFVFFSAPLWLTFLDTLQASFTSYNAQVVNQLPLSQVLGLFDDLFYRQGDLNEVHVDPCTNFLVLAGLLWTIAGFRRRNQDRFVLALGLAAVLPFLLVYGLITRGMILGTPFLRNIAHVDTTFSCLLIVLAFPLAGLGLKRFFEAVARGDWAYRAVGAFAGLGLLALFYFRLGHPAFVSPFFKGYIPSLFAAVIVLHFVFPRLKKSKSRGFGPAIVGTLCLLVLHWRHGQYLRTAFDPYVVNPQVRVDLKAPSSAMLLVVGDPANPTRTVGMGLNLFPGFNQQYLSEGIFGIEALRSREFEDLAQSLGLFRVIAFTTRDANERSASRRAAYNALNVEYFLEGTNIAIPPPPGWSRAADLDLTVYRSLTAWPRAFFTRGIGRYRSVADLAAKIIPADKPLAAVQESDLATLPGIMSLPTPEGGTVAAARNYRFTANSTSFDITATGPGIAVLLESWFKDDFQVTVDGRAAPYFRVNHAFKGVYLESAGVHHVSFAYWPRHLSLSLWMAFGALLLGGVSLGLTRRAGDGKTPDPGSIPTPNG